MRVLTLVLTGLLFAAAFSAAPMHEAKAEGGATAVGIGLISSQIIGSAVGITCTAGRLIFQPAS